MNQAADRPSTSPILAGPLKVPRVGRREHASTGVAVVLRNGKGETTTEWPHRPLDRWEISKARVMWKVDTAPHREHLRLEPYCKGLVHRIQVDLAFTWQVHDPAVVVDRNVTNPPAALRELLAPVVDEVSRRHGPEAAEQVIEDLQRQLADWPLRLDGVTASAPHITVHPDQRHRETAVKLIDIDRKTAVMKGQRRLDDLEWQGTAQRQHAETDLEIELRRKRITAYLEFMKDGLGDPEVALLAALKLAEHPSDVDSVLDHVNAWDHRRRQVTVTALEAMLNARELEGFDLQPARDAVLRLLDGLRDTLPAGPPREAPRQVRARVLDEDADADADDQEAAWDGQPEEDQRDDDEDDNRP